MASEDFVIKWYVVGLKEQTGGIAKLRESKDFVFKRSPSWKVNSVKRFWGSPVILDSVFHFVLQCKAQIVNLNQRFLLGRCFSWTIWAGYPAGLLHKANCNPQKWKLTSWHAYRSKGQQQVLLSVLLKTQGLPELCYPVVSCSKLPPMTLCVMLGDNICWWTMVFALLSLSHHLPCWALPACFQKPWGTRVQWEMAAMAVQMGMLFTFGSVCF